MSPERRKELLYIYTRIASDLRFRPDMFEVARLAAICGNCQPIDFWLASDINTMERLANGTHPAIKTVLEQRP